MTLTSISSLYPTPRAGIVHLGLGAFHRAHQAVYLERLMARHGGGDWGIISANIRSNKALVDQLTNCGHRYHVAEFERRERGVSREVRSIVEALYAGPDGTDRARLFEAMSDPAIRIVTLTITEKGYYLDPATGDLMEQAEPVAHDIAHPDDPHTALGMLVHALGRRHRAGEAPFTVVSCDNMPGNGERTRKAVVQLARHLDGALADWIEAQVAFPSSMVDRIVPAMTGEDHQRLMSLGIEDPAAVVCEAFSQWVIEDRFPGGRPDWEHEGVQMVDDVAPFETMKLRLLNGSHSLLAYLGGLAGIDTVANAVAQPAFRALLSQYMRHEAAPTLTLPEGVDLERYITALLDRFANDSLEHRLLQIAMDGSQKLPQRWLSGMVTQLQAKTPTPATLLGIAGWIQFTAGQNEQGQPHRLDDPMAETLTELHEHHEDEEDALVRAMLNTRSIFPAALAGNEQIIQQLVRLLVALRTRGVTETITQTLEAESARAVEEGAS
ncbi:mannitol dehydrogenase family protein [Larsenimonas suaedae]|uniref:Mannitol dehydrogenase family protein n=1 Tax=Larsenimonas suaedae TaxID=1851019 RepID=A0ABU1GVX8_9GAMM|nr:mannitol dehydrogenase family protein [Larsenimonas suaedae]MCM2973270.1 mannitol dehydrogenase family protein [Larsenimonas suaedae]MDR5896163.1 mannitol dehydrogenase family protein [Larsenimonas suaedae]